MGWWSEEILGGDTPLDALGDLEKAIGWDWEKEGFIYDTKSEVALPKLLAKKNEVSKLIQRMSKEKYDMQHGAVLGIVHVLIQHGFPINKTIAGIAKKAAEQDEWAEDDERRARVVKDFLVALAEATGKKIVEKEYSIKVERKTRATHTFKVKAKSKLQALNKVKELARKHSFTGIVNEFKYD